jgi:hypothetical protein
VTTIERVTQYRRVSAGQDFTVDIAELTWAISAVKSLAADLNHDNGLDAATDVEALSVAVDAMEALYQEAMKCV